MCKKVAYGCYHLIKATQYFPPEILKSLYYAFCHSHIGYCLDSWGMTYKTYIQPLQTLQKRALKIISKPKSNSTSTITCDIFQTQHVLSVKALRNHKISISVNNILCTNFPIPRDVFSFPTRSTRHAQKGNLNLPKCYNVYGERVIEFNGTKIWNTLPLEVKTARNFKQSSKYFFIENQEI